MATLSSVKPRIFHAVIEVTLVEVVTKVLGEVDYYASRAQDREGQNEVDDLCPSVQAGAHDVVVLDEPIRPSDS
jgi:hypothetical protein